MSDAMAMGWGYPVRLLGALYDPGFPYEPERCYLCKQPITPAVWERHHMIPRSASRRDIRLDSRNIVIVCANCHRILTRANDVIRECFNEFRNSRLDPRYHYYTTLDQYEVAGDLEVIRAFYQFLREKWNEILSQLRQPMDDN